MKQEIEIEYKNLLTKSEYKRLLRLYPFQKAIKQHNYYFETAQLQLQKQKSALRIRKKNNEYVLTLKQPHYGQLLETHVEITEDETEQCLIGNFIEHKQFNEQLAKLGVDAQQLNYIGKLVTYRRIYEENETIYVLDRSLYNGYEDFEFELEVNDEHKGKKHFLSILKKAEIKQVHTPNKIERFFKTLPKQI
ncbi:MAG TPA: CYTH domain-containing protein [Bacillota bacterium]|nr:CYTH domain-containing protein [Bacillota bacterium]